MEREIDGVRLDVLELQVQAQKLREDLAMLWRHAAIVTVAVLVIGAWLWLSEQDLESGG